MDVKELSEFIQNESLDDEVLYLKPEFEIDENLEDSSPKQNYDDDMKLDIVENDDINEAELSKEESSPENYGENEESSNVEDDKLNEEFICWKTKSEFEPCCISVHPKFPEVAHVAIGNCGDSCTVYDFDSSNQNIDNGELLVMGPFEETVSCCSFTNCGRYLALGCLDGNLIIYSKNTEEENVVNKDRDSYVKFKKIEKMLTSIEWLDFSEDSNLLVSSGEGGLLILYQLREDELQIISTNCDSTIGQIITYYNSAASNADVNKGGIGGASEKEYNVILGCNDSNLVIVTLNAYYKQSSISKINGNASTSMNKLVNKEEEMDGSVQENVISLCTHSRIKLCSFGTTTGHVSFVNINKKTIVQHYSNIHSGSVESIIFTNNSVNNMNTSCDSPNMRSGVKSELVISIGLDGLIVFYDILNNCNKINVINVPYGLTKIVTHPQKSVFVASSVNGKIIVFNPQKVLKEIKCHKSPILDLQLLNVTGDYYSITVSEDKTIVM